MEGCGPNAEGTDETGTYEHGPAEARTPHSTSPSARTPHSTSKPDGADQDPPDDRLAAVVDAWADLPDAVKAGIVAMVRAAAPRD